MAEPFLNHGERHIALNAAHGEGMPQTASRGFCAFDPGLDAPRRRAGNPSTKGPRHPRGKRHDCGVKDNTAIRLAAFERVAELATKFGDAIPWKAIQVGVDIGAETVLLANRARGIFRPRQMSRGALSIKTTVPRHGRERRYDDIASEDGFFDYRFMGDDPEHFDNQALRECLEDRLPLIYFHGVAPTLYQAIWPVFVTDWNASALSAKVIPGEISQGEITLPDSPEARRYAVVKAKRRLHQAVFRELVLDAYSGHCAISGLPERRLLHAAHILPDRDERGLPVVSNGIAMSVIHHTAYDLNLVGIDPDGGIHLNRDLLEIHDGPLTQALQEVHGKKLKVPRNQLHQPNREYLAYRFEQFQAA